MQLTLNLPLLITSFFVASDEYSDLLQYLITKHEGNFLLKSNNDPHK